MSQKNSKGHPITILQAKELLESIGEERLDQFQRRTLDYTAKFSKVKSGRAETVVTKLMEDFELREDEAVQIGNCMPESIQELRVFLIGGRRIMETVKLKKILAFLKDHRKTK